MKIIRRYLEAARVPSPVARRLRVLAFDPSLTTHLETASFNEIVIQLPWEDLAPGPVGEYVEVVDVDPASGVFYYPSTSTTRICWPRTGSPPRSRTRSSISRWSTPSP